jgi:uncharacterized protein (DUF1810 family)
MYSFDPSQRHSLNRFLLAQDPVIATVRAELRQARKRSHWMWFIFPQLRGLGRSQVADHFGLAGIPEARAYLAHETLGPRLRDCTEILLSLGAVTPNQIFGSTDSLKLGSCLTLFAAIAEPSSPFHQAQTKFFANKRDPLTQTLLDNFPKS